jgi:hypothetical protein
MLSEFEARQAISYACGEAGVTIRALAFFDLPSPCRVLFNNRSIPLPQGEFLCLTIESEHGDKTAIEQNWRRTTAAQLEDMAYEFATDWEDTVKYFTPY